MIYDNAPYWGKFYNEFSLSGITPDNYVNKISYESVY